VCNIFVLTCIDNKGLHADPSAIDVAKDWAQLRKSVTSVVMIAKNCMHDRRVN
jgi:hypothetical protein